MRRTHAHKPTLTGLFFFQNLYPPSPNDKNPRPRAFFEGTVSTYPILFGELYPAGPNDKNPRPRAFSGNCIHLGQMMRTHAHRLFREPTPAHFFRGSTPTGLFFGELYPAQMPHLAQMIRTHARGLFSGNCIHLAQMIRTHAHGLVIALKERGKSAVLLKTGLFSGA